VVCSPEGNRKAGSAEGAKITRWPDGLVTFKGTMELPAGGQKKSRICESVPNAVSDRQTQSSGLCLVPRLRKHSSRTEDTTKRNSNTVPTWRPTAALEPENKRRDVVRGRYKGRDCAVSNSAHR